MAHLKLVAMLALMASVSTAQQYSGGSNYVESDYDYDSAAQPAPPPRPAPRSYSRPAAPSPIRSSGPPTPRVTPVPILKQINRHNEDGSYTYGYEGADGSFKIETKLQTGEVMGKYGYVDDVGKVRIVEYGANKYGFQPAGEGITVAPPTLVDESRLRDDKNAPEFDDGQFYEQVPVRAPNSGSRFSRPIARPAPRPAPPPPTYETYESEEYDFPAPAPAPRPSPPRPSSGSSLGPAPPRAQIPGAVPVPAGPSSGVTYSQPRPAPRPSTISQSPSFSQSSVFSSPSSSSSFSRPSSFPSSARSAPAPAPPVYQAQQRPQGRQSGGGLLDQLAKDYALPPGGHALHDITFGYY